MVQSAIAAGPKAGKAHRLIPFYTFFPSPSTHVFNIFLISQCRDLSCLKASSCRGFFNSPNLRDVGLSSVGVMA